MTASSHKRYFGSMMPAFVREHRLFEIESKVRVENLHEPAPPAEVPGAEDERMRDCYTK